MRLAFFAAHCAMLDLKKKPSSAQNLDVKFSGHFFLGTPRVSEKNCPENKVTLDAPRCVLVHARHCSTSEKNTSSAQKLDVKFSGHFVFGQGGVSEKKVSRKLAAGILRWACGFLGALRNVGLEKKHRLSSESGCQVFGTLFLVDTQGVRKKSSRKQDRAEYNALLLCAC